MKTIIVVMLAAISLHASSQTSDITIGSKIQLRSAILGEDYSILISLPEGYSHKGSTERYPVIYLFDGDSYLGFVSEAVKILSVKNGAGTRQMPQCIVVGITSNHRERDMSPPLMKGWDPPPSPTNAQQVTWGGANKFLEHVEKEIIPFIEMNYRTQPYRIVIGHSLGGLLVYHAMVSKPKLFQSFIVGDPSVWWNDGAEVRKVMSYWKNNSGDKIGVALFRPFVPREFLFPMNKEFMEFIEKSTLPSVFFKYVEVQNENHVTVVYPGVYMALRDLFENYRYKLHPKASLEEARHHYDSLSTVFGYKIPISEELTKILEEQGKTRGR